MASITNLEGLADMLGNGKKAEHKTPGLIKAALPTDRFKVTMKRAELEYLNSQLDIIKKSLKKQLGHIHKTPEDSTERKSLNKLYTRLGLACALQVRVKNAVEVRLDDTDDDDTFL